MEASAYTIQKVKEEIVKVLNLDIPPSEIDTDAPLFGEGLGLDSIDALELLVMMEKQFQVKVSNDEVPKEIFTSVRTLAAYIDAVKA